VQSSINDLVARIRAQAGATMAAAPGAAPLATPAVPAGPNLPPGLAAIAATMAGGAGADARAFPAFAPPAPAALLIAPPPVTSYAEEAIRASLLAHGITPAPAPAPLVAFAPLGVATSQAKEAFLASFRAQAAPTPAPAPALPVGFAAFAGAPPAPAPAPAPAGLGFAWPVAVVPLPPAPVLSTADAMAAAAMRPVLPVSIAQPGDYVGLQGFPLYLDCLPENQELQWATDILQEALSRLRAAGRPDYRSEDYGKGRGILADTVHQILAEPGSYRAGVAMVLSTTDDSQASCQQIFRSFASSVVRGAK